MTEAPRTWDNRPDFACPNCFSLMIPPDHIPMQLSCGHILCSACHKQFSELDVPCVVCSTPIERAHVSSVLSNLALQYSRDHSTSIVSPESTRCTFLHTGKSYSMQRWYWCATCGLSREQHLGICEACAKTCHAGHKCAYTRDCPAYCDCIVSGYPCSHGTST